MDKDYWRLKKREQRAKAKGDKSDKPAVVLPAAPVVHAVDMLKCPEGVDTREWKYALERASRAKKYAEMFPNHVRPSEVQYQDPVWQWENEVRGRFGGIVGGNLKQ
jgi:hypothetical protein